MIKHMIKTGPAVLAGLIILNLITTVWISTVSAGQDPPRTRVVTDRSGRQVRIPAAPKKVACLFGPSYEKLLALGAADRVAMVANVRLPWNFELNPALKTLPSSDTYGAPDVEKMLASGVDLVIYHPFVRQIQQMTAAGLPVVVPYDGSIRQHTLENFLEDCYGQMLFYGKVLGPAAENQAMIYCAYADERIRKVTRITSRIPESQRPRVFYFCGQVGGPAGTQTRHSTADWLVTAAGGTMLTHDEASYFITVSTEEMILWNPDIIVVSTLPSIDPVMKNPQYKGIKAVQNHQVVMSPEGQFYWSHFSSESFLCVLFLAKLFHPDRFPDLDLTRELKDYYAKFYHYPLTSAQAEKILAHLPPGSAR